MRRRDFIKVIACSAVALPLAARAQQQLMPVIGFLNVATAKDYASQLSAFLKGLSEVGYVDGQNVTIEYRWAEGQRDRPAFIPAGFSRATSPPTYRSSSPLKSSCTST